MRRFDCKDTTILYNTEKNAIVCIANHDGHKKWVKRLNEPVNIQNVLFDERFYYVACQMNEREGIFMTVDKHNGSTAWFIPGRTFLEILYRGFLYLIFIDENERFFLVKADCDKGNAVWYHEIDSDLYYYHFKEDIILLHFASGKKEAVDYDGMVRVISS